MTFDDYIAKVEAGEIPVETHGHLSYALEPRSLRSTLMFERLVGHSGEADPQIEFPWVKEGDCLGKCAICGREPSTTFHEDRIEAEDNHFDVGPFSVDIEFPSGIMIFDDGFHAGYEDFDRNINTTIGIKQCSEDYAKQGMMHFFVGNSCPAIWREGDTIYVGSLSDADDHKGIGSICTDLWWASFVDQWGLASKLTAARVKGEERADATRGQGTVKVTPGTYRCTSYYHVRDLDYGTEGTQVYCKLEPKGPIRLTRPRRDGPKPA